MILNNANKLTYRLVTTMTRSQKQAVFLLLDAVIVAVSFVMAMILTMSFAAASLIAPDLLMTMAGAMIVTWWLRLPQTTLKNYDMNCVVRTAMFAVTTAVFAYFVHAAVPIGLDANFFAIFALLLLVLGAGWRILALQATTMIYRSGQPRERLLIYGAGQTGRQLAAALAQDDKVTPVTFVDDNPRLQSQTVAGLRVHAPSKIKDLVAEKAIDRIVLAMPSISRSVQARITHGLRHIGCEVHALPSFAAFVSAERGTQKTSASLDQLLGRTGLEKELPGVNHAYAGRHILITGAGGSIGSELCRQMLDCRPGRIVLLDHSEFALYQIHKELRALDETMRVVPVLGSVLDQDLMRGVIQEHSVDVVLHAAAYKHVPMVERNALVGLENNVFGTKRLADVARDQGVDRFILVSSDKAVRPTNVMGASKRLAELVIQDLATRSPGTRFSMVRFGNVLGSSGSVVPLFEDQIAHGGPVTVTHQNVTRYFMTVTEATRLVLLAGSFARGGDVFVLDMGDPVRIFDLARQMIEGAGYSIRDDKNPSGDIEIRITGLRSGEKLHEELLISSDMLTTPHQKILRAEENLLSEFEIATALKDLRYAIETQDEDAARAIIARWVERGSLHEASLLGR